MIVTQLPVTRCQICHRTVAYRPGNLAEVLTDHYRRAHPEALDLMFFEPLPAGEESAPRRLPERPPWSGPPALEAGAVLAVEWPFGGIELTIAELDGAAIVAAAGRSAHYWRDTADSPES